MHVAVNMVSRCSVVLMLGPASLTASVWRLVAACDPLTLILRDDRLLYPASFSKSINLRVYELS